jgi:hypothetical protein
MGRRYAVLQARYNIDLADAVAALSFFRAAVVQSAGEFALGVGSPIQELVNWVQRLDLTLDRVLIAMVIQARELDQAQDVKPAKRSSEGRQAGRG